MRTNEIKTDHHENRIDQCFFKNAYKEWRDGFGFLSVMAVPGLMAGTAPLDVNDANTFTRLEHSLRPKAASNILWWESWGELKREPLAARELWTLMEPPIGVEPTTFRLRIKCSKLKYIRQTGPEYCFKADNY